ncbi:N-formylglutamate amidohydrolase [Winogradskyella litoriviva]|uniref:N-formylglutamate amidohydrolase n=1 Tax=Winogradskyella litoriviva TaxID=1220182 RepID=A0ABX2E8K0_9FLAO|nr:N-formylglutamate amidohydrolase [Winogradskyella litoriviva]NRD24823.1 N-formylglutamate amidohydrolase [Winogradskyella litoriviva]
MKLVLTCEHGGNEIPYAYIKYFKNKAILETHRGYDLGALDMFQTLVPLCDATYFSTISRLLVELNRSLHHKNLFSEFTKNISQSEKTEIIQTYYLPYRTAVENNIQRYIAKGEAVLHLSIHSFTSVLNSVERNCDIGLLYDSSKKPEQQFCKDFKAELKKQNSNLKVRFNYPYLGKADGFTTYLRKQFSDNYIGIEIEVNQKFTNENKIDLAFKNAIFKAIHCIKSKS